MTPTLYLAAEAVVPIRAEPRHSAELGSQALFGECGLGTERSPDGEWLRWQGLTDQYEGWVRLASLHPIGEQAPMAYRLARDTVQLDVLDDGVSTRLAAPRGSRLPVLADLPEDAATADLDLSDGRIVRLRLADWPFAHPQPRTEAELRHFVTELETHYLNSPYLWGGKTPAGLDCSGLVQVAFALYGVELPRDAYQQATVGEAVAWGEHRTGDLAFFANASGRVTHVGILADADHILHAAGSGRVRLDSVRAEGIWHSHRQELTHTLHSLRRHFLL